jgi:hypothetical protein
MDMAFVAVVMAAPIDVLQWDNIRHNNLDIVHKFFSDCEQTVLPSILGMYA